MTLYDDLDEAIQSCLHANATEAADKGVLTAWIIIVETMGSDGNRYLAHYGDEDSPPWVKLGMLGFIQKAIAEHMIYGREEEPEEQ